MVNHLQPAQGLNNDGSGLVGGLSESAVAANIGSSVAASEVSAEGDAEIAASGVNGA